MEQQALVQEILGGVAEMMETQRREIFAYIENGVQKDGRTLAEKVDSMDKRLTAVEETLGDLCEDMDVVKKAVTHQGDEIKQLRQA